MGSANSESRGGLEGKDRLDLGFPCDLGPNSLFVLHLYWHAFGIFRLLDGLNRLINDTHRLLNCINVINSLINQLINSFRQLTLAFFL